MLSWIEHEKKSFITSESGYPNLRLRMRCPGRKGPVHLEWNNDRARAIGGGSDHYAQPDKIEFCKIHIHILCMRVCAPVRVFVCVCVNSYDSDQFLQVQQPFSGSNTDGSYTTAISNSFLSPLAKIPKLQIWDNLGCLSFLYWKWYILCTDKNRLNSNENTQPTYMLKKIEKLRSLFCLLTWRYD